MTNVSIYGCPKYEKSPALSAAGRDSPFRSCAFALPQGLLISCNQMSAEYLFMQDKLYDVRYDTGDKVIQCGRHNDIFKLWLQWRAKVGSQAKKYKVF